MVMGKDSCTVGCGFESQHRILEKVTLKSCNVCLKKTRNKQKEAAEGPFFKK